MKNWFRFTLQLNGFPIKSAERALSEIQAVSEAATPDFLEQKKQEILEHHLENNAFYRRFCGGRTCSNWNEVPILTKRDLQRPLKERLSIGYSPRNIFVGKTSGSGGKPLIFAKDRFCHALSWAEFFDRYAWFGIDLNKSLQARFYGIPLDRMGYLKEQIKDRLGHRKRFPVFQLEEAVMEAFLRNFRQQRFDYINGYTSPIVFFARFLQQKKIVLKEVCPSLKLCIVTSEMLFQEERILLERQLGIPVVNEYGTSECGLLAFENTAQEWILNKETQFVEVVDEQGEVLPKGREGRIVVTSLFNKAHPFIRYDIGDRGSISADSSIKKPVLKNLLGRCNDMVFLPSGKTVPGLSFYYVTKSIMDRDMEVKEFVVQQLTRERFRVIYVSEKELSPRKLTKIRQTMALYLEEGLEIEFEHVAFLNRSSRGKLKQFESLL